MRAGSICSQVNGTALQLGFQTKRLRVANSLAKFLADFFANLFKSGSLEIKLASGRKFTASTQGRAQNWGCDLKIHWRLSSSCSTPKCS